MSSLLTGNFNFPSLSSSASSSLASSSSGMFNSGGISGSPLDYSGANESFLNDIGSSLTPSSSNGYNFGLGTGMNSLINSSNSFINNTLTSGINEGIINPLTLSTSTLTNLASGQNATGQAVLPTSTSSIFNDVGGALSSISNDIANGANALLGIKNVTQQATGLFGLSSPAGLTTPASSGNLLTSNQNPFAATSSKGLFNTPANANYSGILTDLMILGAVGVGFVIVISLI